MEGVVRAPSEFSITLGLPPSMIATQELVVPRSMPMILLMSVPQFVFRLLSDMGFPPLFSRALATVTSAGRRTRSCSR